MGVQDPLSKVIPWLCLAILPWVLTGCGGAAAKPDDPLVQLQQQIAALRNDINQDRKAETERMAIVEKNRADYLADSEEMKSKLQAIDSKLNEYNERMNQLAEKLDNLQTKFNEELENRQMGRIPTPGYTPPTTTNPQSSTTGTSPVTNSGEAASSVNPMGNPSHVNPTPPTGQTGSLPQLPSVPPSPAVGGKSEDLTSPERLYQTAQNEYNQGNYDVAIAGFQKYLELYPNAELADLAQYQIAEAFFNLKAYETALKEYDKLINLYPKSKRLPWAYYNKAQAFLKLGRQLEATSHLRYILTQFPNSEVAEKAREDLARLGG
ncbi:MAG TPA: outer membrane protein assembly factor BamD [Candidatus Limnocylindrales bacterium]|nr:outer membrane protein assembly factor BamD [Candidatus Limnocylindrales bacterium]